MAKAKYEVTYIIKSGIDEDSKKASIDRFDKVVTDNDAEELESKDWGKRRFVYEIEKYREDTYHIITFAAEDSESIDEFGHLSRIDNQVLRLMTVRLGK